MRDSTPTSLAVASTANARITRVIEPLQLKVIHPPDLWDTLHGDIDTKTLDVGEVVKEDKVGQHTVLTSRAPWSGRKLSVWLITVASHWVAGDTSKLPLAGRTQGIAPDRSSNSIEAVATKAQVWTIGDLSRGAVLPWKWEVVVAGDIDIALSLELQNQWGRLWDEWDTWRWADSKSFREVEVLIRAGDWKWLVNITNKRRDVIELLLVSIRIEQTESGLMDLR